QLAVGNIFLTDSVRALSSVYIFIEVFWRRPHMCLVQVSEYPCAVNSLPIERIVRELVRIVPCHLGGEEVFNVAALHNLRDRSGITEGIRQPESVRGKSEILPGKALSPQELTDHRLTGSDVAVALHPDTAVWLVAPFLNLFLNP